jgi:dUTP pyrophosphatase
MTTKISIKYTDENCKLKRAYSKDACSDCCSTEDVIIQPGRTAIIPLGFHLALPSGWEAQIRPRSGLSAKDIVVRFGTVDESYTGMVKANVHNESKWPFTVNKYDRVCQIAFREVPAHDLVEVDTLPETDRGDKGFGSSGVATAVLKEAGWAATAATYDMQLDLEDHINALNTGTDS